MKNQSSKPLKVIVASATLVLALLLGFLYHFLGVQPEPVLSQRPDSKAAMRFMGFLQTGFGLYHTLGAGSDSPKNTALSDHVAIGWPEHFGDLERLRNKDIYPASWMENEDGFRRVQSLLDDPVNLEGLRAVSAQKPFRGYYFLMPAPSDMALSGTHAGTLPVDSIAGYEVVATPAHYDDIHPLTYFMSSDAAHVFAKDIGRTVQNWADLKQERPLLADGGWKMLQGNFAGMIEIEEEKLGGTKDLTISEDVALATLFGIGMEQKRLENEKKSLSQQNFTAEERIGAIKKILPSKSNGGNLEVTPTETTENRIAYRGYYYLLPNETDSLLSGEDNDYAKRFEIIATPIDYPQSGRYTFYYNSSTNEYRAKDIGRQMKFWRDFEEINGDVNISFWGKAHFPW